MDSDLTTIRNIGPATARALVAAGIPDAQTLHRIGAHEAYRALLQSGERPHFIGYYVLCMAVQGRPWNDCKGPEKDELRARFDGLVAETRAPTLTGIEAALDAIGLRAPGTATSRPRGSRN
ncbi:TfoX/Sxy family protein [Paracoccus sp. 1_MG-2023]|uniref:TfoX/Sxy family protein n=1 Tax=unclassified Paracoccus (in: a-proteobacteria) TaxID=2688777 RepID=UPI001C0822F9|nr:MULTISPECIES: TfoX/Sxy family protein [unclassified Paracoccus (in: a-proteobacteria)]MBU2956437.1 TfoX/Sxy family protein [Paracoccus sp. C2R09]MDO6669829.1 TfoX/Sxy family protein [Paracoccus sp. 1_MG-2023]